ncbi:C6 zinc finger domain-containing protein (nucleus protein) [Colletotrichum tofieldiae]|uniref:C6 zinc finger domain-containing protein (Nucleus protein) n=1 Tax=Colletotrichum tofieldiae TaxID=708197 RepID=A0A166WCS5_9PEZI|nr:C6 zinc finger domain-containing protein (nucleus protein) [Colletotrichum tofieldiae]
MPTYDELAEENRRLKALVAAPAHDVSKRKPARRLSMLECHDPLEEIVFSPAPSSNLGERRRCWDHLSAPCRETSEYLVGYDKKWNSWVHYALEYPAFDHEHARFLASLEAGGALRDYDPAWLSVYFSVITAALLMMDDEEAQRIIPQGDHQELLRDWYEAAVFCLEQADFMRRNDVRCVQAIAILGMCFYNFGDSGLARHLWSCAIRIAQDLGLDGSGATRAAAELGREAQCRLWWTLVICEWLAVPYHVPQVEWGDFDVPLPSVASDSVSADGVQPVLYHIFMARTATVYHGFRSALRDGTRPVDEVVRSTDEALAEVINTLPDHLQPDSGRNKGMRELEDAHPWVKWQRFDISLVLLHHRMRINRALQNEWLEAPGQYDWARGVCIRSAMDIIWITHNWDQPAAMRRQWALSLHVFVAAVFLLRESQRSGAEVDFGDEVQLAVEYLDEVKSRNAVAERAVEILRKAVDSMEAIDS